MVRRDGSRSARYEEASDREVSNLMFPSLSRLPFQMPHGMRTFFDSPTKIRIALDLGDSLDSMELERVLNCSRGRWYMKNWKNMDYLGIVHYLVWIAGLVLIVSALILAFENSGSRNLAISTSVVVGAVVAFLIQAKFELTSSTKSDHISFAYTFDLAKRELRADYSKVTDIGLLSGRIDVELDAGKWIFDMRPSMNEADRKKVVSDFAILSALTYFGRGDRDWQSRYKKYNSPSLGFSVREPLSSPSDCTSINGEEIRSKLRAANNFFSDVPSLLTFTDICLPPDTKLFISSTSIVLRNPIFTVELALEEPEGGSYLEPGSHAGTVAFLSDGRPRFETYMRALRIKTTFSALRANHLFRGKYEEWAKTLVDRLAVWFACC